MSPTNLSPNAQLHNLVLSFLYQRVRQRRSNLAIRQELERKGFPPITDNGLDLIRREFVYREAAFPAQMSRFRKMLKVR